MIKWIENRIKEIKKNIEIRKGFTEVLNAHIQTLFNQSRSKPSK